MIPGMINDLLRELSALAQDAMRYRKLRLRATHHYGGELPAAFIVNVPADRIILIGYREEFDAAVDRLA